jgi:hypothetical protein
MDTKNEKKVPEGAVEVNYEAMYESAVAHIKELEQEISFLKAERSILVDAGIIYKRSLENGNR